MTAQHTGYPCDAQEPGAIGWGHAANVHPPASATGGEIAEMRSGPLSLAPAVSCASHHRDMANTSAVANLRIAVSHGPAMGLVGIMVDGARVDLARGRQAARHGTQYGGRGLRLAPMPGHLTPSAYDTGGRDRGGVALVSGPTAHQRLYEHMLTRPKAA